MFESTEAALLRTIIESPDDDTPRLVYADFLEEAGETERAELIRLQCELTGYTSAHPAYALLKQREQELLNRFQVEWKNRLPELPGVHWEAFERGCVAAVRVEDPHTLFAHAQLLFGATPIQRLSLHRVFPNEAARLAELPQLASIRTLDLEDGNQIRNEGLRAIADSKYLRGLRQLKLRSNRIGPAGVRDLVESPNVRNLLLLDLDNNEIYDDGARYVAGAENLRQLTMLSLGWTRCGNPGLAALATSPFLTRLTWLYLTGNDIDDVGAESLAAAKTMDRLQSLYLASNRIGDRGISALARSAVVKKLRCLYLKQNRIGDKGAMELVRSPYLAGIEELILSENPISAEASDELRQHFGAKRVWLW